MSREFTCCFPCTWMLEKHLPGKIQKCFPLLPHKARNHVAEFLIGDQVVVEKAT